MPFVKWRKEPGIDLTPDEPTPPIGKNVLSLTDIKESGNYTCIAKSELGTVNETSYVKVHCKFSSGNIGFFIDKSKNLLPDS